MVQIENEIKSFRKILPLFRIAMLGKKSLGGAELSRIVIIPNCQERLNNPKIMPNNSGKNQFRGRNWWDISAICDFHLDNQVFGRLLKLCLIRTILSLDVLCSVLPWKECNNASLIWRQDIRQGELLPKHQLPSRKSFLYGTPRYRKLRKELKQKLFCSNWHSCMN